MKFGRIQKISTLVFAAIFSWQGITFSSDAFFFQEQEIFISAGGKRIAMEENREKFFILNDHLGSSVVHLDNLGNEVSHTEYKSFGAVKSETSTKTFNKKFTGKELDDSTGLYDYEARQYDANIGRFITADTADPKLEDPQTLNRYSYTLNNPLKYIDPTGHAAESPYDVASAMLSAAEFSENPNLTNAAFLAADLIAVATPGLPAPGLAVRALRAVGKGDDIGRTSKFGKVVGDASDLSESMRDTLRGGRADKIVLEKDLNVGRIFGGGSKKKGDFFTTSKINTVEQVKNKLSLPSKNNATRIVKATIPRGSTIYKGVVAGKFGRPGGGTQIVTAKGSRVRYGSVKTIRKR